MGNKSNGKRLTDLPNCVSKKQIHFMALIVITLENFTLRTLRLLPPEIPERLLLAHICLITYGG